MQVVKPTERRGGLESSGHSLEMLGLCEWIQLWNMLLQEELPCTSVVSMV